MKDKLLSTAISFHIFNRPNETKQVFEKIKAVRPQKLFITADGPRENISGDHAKCLEARSIINNIDWDCELYTNFSEINKGSFLSTSNGISWVFEHVDRAIILEDDCVPCFSFFKFCHELLEYYEDDARVSVISGNNFQDGVNITKDSYYFSSYTHIWGWATWKRTWELLDFSMCGWPRFKESNGLKNVLYTKKSLYYWNNIFQNMYDKKSKLHWDYLLLLSTWMNNSLTITPNKNLVSNIGFGEDASNCKTKTKFHCLVSESVDFPLIHPPYVSRFFRADVFIEKNMFNDNHFKRWLLNFTPKKVLELYRYIKKYIKPRV